MTCEDDAVLQDADEWDWEHAERRSPVANPRAVVSVAFSPNDLARIDDAARQAGVMRSAFIRRAALEAAGVSATPHCRTCRCFAGGEPQP